MNAFESLLPKISDIIGGDDRLNVRRETAPARLEIDAFIGEVNSHSGVYQLAELGPVTQVPRASVDLVNDNTVDGKTVVAKLDNDRVSLNPTIMVNFISREGTTLLRPMVQFGASTSKEAPALFMGAGWRLFGAKRSGFAFGGGLMLAWVKDLKTLEEDVEVGGTKDIEEDLQFDWSRPKPRLYWSLQYTF